MRAGETLTGRRAREQGRTLARGTLACMLLAALAGGAARCAAPAQASRTLRVYDEGHLHYVRSSGNELIDEGHASGTMPGSVVVHFTYNGNPTVYASFTIHASKGTISGYAKGHLSNPTSPSPSFRGALSLSGGAGRYAHAHGTGELFGVFYRRSYAMTVQTRGGLAY